MTSCAAGVAVFLLASLRICVPASAPGVGARLQIEAIPQVMSSLSGPRLRVRGAFSVPHQSSAN